MKLGKVKVIGATELKVGGSVGILDGLTTQPHA